MATFYYSYFSVFSESAHRHFISVVNIITYTVNNIDKPIFKNGKKTSKPTVGRVERHSRVIYKVLIIKLL